MNVNTRGDGIVPTSSLVFLQLIKQDNFSENDSTRQQGSGLEFEKDR